MLRVDVRTVTMPVDVRSSLMVVLIPIGQFTPMVFARTAILVNTIVTGVPREESLLHSKKETRK
jgi:hypothetical protein